MANHLPHTSAQNTPASFDMLVYSGKAFDIACTLETLRAAMPDDQLNAEISVAYMVGMLARQAMELAELLFSLPFELVEPTEQGGAHG